MCVLEKVAPLYNKKRQEQKQDPQQEEPQEEDPQEEEPQEEEPQEEEETDESQPEQPQGEEEEAGELTGLTSVKVDPYVLHVPLHSLERTRMKNACILGVNKSILSSTIECSRKESIINYYGIDPSFDWDGLYSRSENQKVFVFCMEEKRIVVGLCFTQDSKIVFQQ